MYHRFLSMSKDVFLTLPDLQNGDFSSNARL